jgi:hypothetical protein
MTVEQKRRPPLTCPLLKTCNEKINEEFFHSRCHSKNWIHCDKAKSEAAEYLHKPCEWNIMKMPDEWLKPKIAPKQKRTEKKKRFFRKLK